MVRVGREGRGGGWRGRRVVVEIWVVRGKVRGG